jgi:large subunit ribosomal protein L25
MEEFVLNAQKRTVIGKQVKAIRRQGKLPGIIYGEHLEPTPIELDTRTAAKLLAQTSASRLITIKLDEADHKVLVRDIQYDVIFHTPIHVDFLKVEMDTAIRTFVPIDLVGEAPAVKEFNGVLTHGLTEIEVEALPMDLPEHIDVDLGALKNIDSVITVADIYVGKGVKLLTDPDEVIVQIVPQEVEELVEEEVEVVVETLAEPELVERRRKEESEEE